MSSSVFRSSSLERVSSPEQLNEFIRVSKPSIWLVLAATIIFLGGVIVWGIFGTLTTTQETVAVVSDGKVISFIPAADVNKLSVGMEVQISDSVGQVTEIINTPIQITEAFDPYTIYIGGFKVGDWVYPVSVQIDLADGVYPAEIIIEKLSPISLVLN